MSAPSPKSVEKASPSAETRTPVPPSHAETGETPPAFTPSSYRKARKLYAWWSWHPKYPYWSRSCWEGDTIDEAWKELERPMASKMRLYFNVLVREDDDGFTEVSPVMAPCEEVNEWNKRVSLIQDANHEESGRGVSAEDEVIEIDEEGKVHPPGALDWMRSPSADVPPREQPNAETGDEQLARELAERLQVLYGYQVGLNDLIPAILDVLENWKIPRRASLTSSGESKPVASVLSQERILPIVSEKKIL